MVVPTARNQSGNKLKIQGNCDNRTNRSLIFKEISKQVLNSLTVENPELYCRLLKTVFHLIDGQGYFSSWNPLAEKFNLSAVDILEW